MIQFSIVEEINISSIRYAEEMKAQISVHVCHQIYDFVDKVHVPVGEKMVYKIKITRCTRVADNLIISGDIVELSQPFQATIREVSHRGTTTYGILRVLC